MKPVPVVVESTRINGAPARCATCQKCGATRAQPLTGYRPGAVVQEMIAAMSRLCPHKGEVGKHFVSSAPPGVTLAYVHPPWADDKQEVECWATGSFVFCVVGEVKDSVEILVRFAEPKHEGAAQEFVKTLAKWGYRGRVVRDPEPTHR